MRNRPRQKHNDIVRLEYPWDLSRCMCRTGLSRVNSISEVSIGYQARGILFDQRYNQRRVGKGDWTSLNTKSTPDSVTARHFSSDSIENIYSHITASWAFILWDSVLMAVVKRSSTAYCSTWRNTGGKARVTEPMLLDRNHKNFRKESVKVFRNLLCCVLRRTDM